MVRRIVVLVSDGFTDSGLSIALDVFRTANAVAEDVGKRPPFRVDVVSAGGGAVRASSGVVLKSTATPRLAARADVLLVPGLWATSGAEAEASLERADVKRLIQVLARGHARGATIGASCSGAFLLGDAGLLDGRDCTTTWWLSASLRRRRPLARVDADRALVVAGRVLTAGAVFAQADLTLHLVARFAGPRTARLCSRLLLLDLHPSQAAYMAIRQLTADDSVVRRAETWVRGHLGEDFEVGDLARQVGVNPRTLARRLTAAVGVGPLGFVQRLRVESAVHLLETTRLSLQEICARVGYQDAHALRRLVQRETQASPRELRRRPRPSSATLVAAATREMNEGAVARAESRGVACRARPAQVLEER